MPNKLAPILMRHQTRLESLQESLHNVYVGFTISLASSFIVFPLAGIESPSPLANIQVVLYFTIIAIARSYTIRRYHIWKAKRKYGV